MEQKKIFCASHMSFHFLLRARNFSTARVLSPIMYTNYRQLSITQSQSSKTEKNKNKQTKRKQKIYLDISVLLDNRSSNVNKTSKLV